MSLLDDVLARIDALTPVQRAALADQVATQTQGQRFIPSPGPQMDAMRCAADVLLYGGSGGSGKSALLSGLALTQHQRSLLMRRRYTDLMGGGGLIDETLRLYGSRDGFNGSSPPTLRTDDGRVITFGGAANAGDEEAFQGRARDLLGIDEAAQFARSQIRFLMGWVRSTEPGQRCRTVLATNPPLSAEGEFIIEMFRPWLDLTHSNPAKAGELRWFVTAPDGSDLEVDGPRPVELDGRTLLPQSRTFIPGKLADNPFLAGTGYEATLDSLPEPMRSAIRDGNFMASRQDDLRQVIPTGWIREAQARWSPEPPQGAPMCAIGVDVAQGGPDRTAIACRYDGWFAPVETFPGVDTPTGNEVAGLVLSRRRNGAVVVVDMGGGYGGHAYARLKENGIECIAFKGAEGSRRRTADQTLKFANKRAESYWRFREALDPGQDGGSPIMLPDDPEMVADLTSARFDVGPNGIRLEPKETAAKMLGRSPDKGDAVVMAWHGGPVMATHGKIWRDALKGASTVNVVRSRASVKRAARRI